MPVGCFKTAARNKGKYCSPDGNFNSPKLGVPDAMLGTATVILERRSDDDILGLVFTGGADKRDKPHITCLKTGGIASRCDGLQIDDYITAIHDTHTDQLKHEEIITLLKNAGPIVQLQIAYTLPPKVPQSAYSVKCKRVTVTLLRDDDSFGFVVRGGFCEVRAKSRPLTITSIRPGGSAHRDGTMRVGDRILTINGVNVLSATLSEAKRLIHHQMNRLVLVLEYDIAVMDAVQATDGPLLVEISRNHEVNIGLTLAQTTYRNKQVIVIDKIKTASLAERCGAFYVGDIVLAINAIDLSNMSLLEAEHFLISGNSQSVQLEILAIGHMKDRISEGATRTASQSSSHSHLNQSYYSVFSDHTAPLRTLTSRFLQPMGSQNGMRKSTLRSAGSLVSSGNSIMYHEELLETSLFVTHRCVGLTLHCNAMFNEILRSPPYIGFMDTQSCADKCGVLQEGDRILAINGLKVIGRTLAECTELLENCSKKLTLLVAFDVADGFVPSSGIFQIKLAKRGGSLGITLAGRESATIDKFGVVIAEVRKGGPAYRSGTLKSGDRLLSIDNISLENCTAADASQILINTDEVVKLNVKKVETDNSSDPSLIFTVEIPKNNGSLGLTISGKEQPFQPIYISEITPGSIADSIGAVQVGDLILAINGKNLRGLPVSHAIQLLHSSDVVSLKINRILDSTSKKGLSGSNKGRKRDLTKGQSGDSAVESWDSSAPSASSREEGKDKTRNASDFSQIINELETIGKSDISGMFNSKGYNSSNQRNPSTSSPHDNSRPAPQPNLPDLPSTGKLLTISIEREPHENYGFGLSNGGDYDEKGCYICAVGESSPADRAGLMKYDKLIQVNDINVQMETCMYVVPLIENAGQTLDLVVIRESSNSGIAEQSKNIRYLSSSLDKSSVCSY